MIDKGVRELERKLQVTSTDRNQERQIIKDMQFLKESKPFILQNEQLREQIYQKKQEKIEVGKDLGDYKT